MYVGCLSVASLRLNSPANMDWIPPRSHEMVFFWFKSMFLLLTDARKNTRDIKFHRKHCITIRISVRSPNSYYGRDIIGSLRDAFQCVQRWKTEAMCELWVRISIIRYYDVVKFADTFVRYVLVRKNHPSSQFADGRSEMHRAANQ